MRQLKFIFRKLWRDRFFTILKIIGLAIGMAVCLIIFKIVHYEFSFDKNHPDKESIHQLVTWRISEENKRGFGGVQSAVGEYIEENFPELEQIVPLNNAYFQYMSIKKSEDEIFRKEDPKNIDKTVPDYFDLVPYQWLAGDKNTAFLNPNQVVLTKSRAEKYFGKLPVEEILGETVYYEETPFTISGIIADLDFPSSFEGKEFIPISKEEKANANWFTFSSSNNLFVKILPNQKERLLNALDAKYDEMTPDFMKSGDTQIKYDLLPLSERHFSKEFNTGYGANKKIVLGLIGIGLFILLLAGINYINLSTAQIPYRTKEIGVRKTLGEKGSRLTIGFLLETLIICLFAMLLAFPLSKGFEFFYPDFMPLGIGEYSTVLPISLFVVGLLLVLTFLTGLYPAYLINKINVSEVLKIQGAGKLSFGNLTIRKVMIVFQFIIAQVFVIGAFIISSQIHFMIHSDLGFDKDAILTIELPYKSYHNADVDPFLYKQALKKHPEIQGVALGLKPMDMIYYGNDLIAQSDSTENRLNMSFKYIDTDYIDLFGIKILAGRKPEFRDSVGGVFINEAARLGLGFKTNEEAVNQTVKDFSGTPMVIIGIVNDFHQAELNILKAPLALRSSTDKDRLTGISIKLPQDSSQWSEVLGILEKEWKVYYPNAPFNYKFYDSEIEKLYESDMRQAKMIHLATIITIILGCLGLIGLVTLTAYQRTKEIGIRKVLGSSVSDVVVLLSKDYLKLIGIAILISIPIAWWGMSKWLEDFAYRIEIQWWMFLLTGITTILIALLAVSYRAIKAAMANPVESLRDE